MRFDQAKRYGLIHGVITEGIYGRLLACPYLPTRNVDLSRSVMKRTFLNDTHTHENTSQVKKTLMNKIRENGPSFEEMDSSEFPDIPKLIPAESYVPMQPKNYSRPEPTSMTGEEEEDWGEEIPTSPRRDA